eukprot:scaffold125765_cov43-Cyclotella_meneghiniana.AAC.1
MVVVSSAEERRTQKSIEEVTARKNLLSSSFNQCSTTPTVTCHFIIAPSAIQLHPLTSPPSRHYDRMQSLESLSPIRARRWEESNNAVRERNVQRRLRQVMTDHIDDDDSYL